MVTAILNVYRRPELLQAQIKALQRQTIPPRYIWVWQNKSPEKHKIKVPAGCVLVKSNYNFLYHGRFSLALFAQKYTEFAMILDDDIIPGNRWIENCINSYKQQPGLYVATGNRLNSPFEKEGEKRQWFGWRGPNENITEIDYGGHIWFFKSTWIKHFWGEEPISLDNAEDIQLSFAFQKNGGIKTYTPPHPLNDKSLWGNTVDWKYGKTAVASQKNPPTGISRKDWFRQRREIEQECIKRGWKPMYMRGEQNQ